MTRIIHENERSAAFCHSGGFTLMEVLVATVALSVCLVTILIIFQTQFMALESSRDTLTANLLASEKMSEVMASAGEGQKTELVSERGRFSGENSDFLWETRVSVPDLPDIGMIYGEELREVIVSVWRDGSDERRSVSAFVRVESGNNE